MSGASAAFVTTQLGGRHTHNNHNIIINNINNNNNNKPKNNNRPMYDMVSFLGSFGSQGPLSC